MSFRGRPDILFVGGLDWLWIAPTDRPRSRTPIINLVQHVRHGDPAHPLYEFLSHRAVRICVSAEVAAAISATRRVNGPIHVIPNGIDLAETPAGPRWDERLWDTLIVAVKAPDLGTTLAHGLAAKGYRVRLVDSWIPRDAFLAALAGSRVAILLPNVTRGYLPALEAMAAGALVVCPDCVGNRSFSRSGRNCLQPEYTAADIVAKALSLLTLDPAQRDGMLSEASKTAAERDLMTERRAFLGVLQWIEDTW